MMQVSVLKLVENQKLQIGEFQKFFLTTEDANLVKELQEAQVNQNIGDQFYLFEKNFFNKDEGNSKTWQIGLTLIPRSVPQSLQLTLEVNKKKFSVQLMLNESQIVQQEQIIPKLGFIEENWDYDRFREYFKDHKVEIISSFVFVLSAIFVTIVYFVKKYKEKKKILHRKIEIKNQMLNANSRLELESVYLKKDDWKIFVTSSEDFEIYKKSMQEYLYLPEWDEQCGMMAKEKTKNIAEKIKLN